VEQAEALALNEVLVANLEKLVNEDLDPTAPEGKALRVSSTLDPK
jgi:hypothetical protein